MGIPLELYAFPARTETNPQFAGHDLSSLDVVHLPATMARLVDDPPVRRQRFLEDDNRGAVLPDPIATLDGLPFYLSVKGIGSTVDPYSFRPLDARNGATLTQDDDVRSRLVPTGDGALPAEGEPPHGEERLVTGELWLRGSPYGGQGEGHARIALEVSRRADLTSLEGFLIAPVLKIAYFPPALEERVRTLHWYRKYPGHIVQELRLVPSNIRVYFHARRTMGHDMRVIFDQFGISRDGQVRAFEARFLRSGIAMLTLFARTLRHDRDRDVYYGLDFHDVWLDKDAVLAPNGSVYFVDLEGIEEVGVERGKVRERIEDQIYRSLYELMFAYEQIEQERARRFGPAGTRKERFETTLREALAPDPYVGLRRAGSRWELEIRNKCNEEDLISAFPALEVG